VRIFLLFTLFLVAQTSYIFAKRTTSKDIYLILSFSLFQANYFEVIVADNSPTARANCTFVNCRNDQYGFKLYSFVF